MLQKVIGYPFDPFACGIRELLATPRSIHVCQQRAKPSFDTVTLWNVSSLIQKMLLGIGGEHGKMR
jgi:hypothetical protein